MASKIEKSSILSNSMKKNFLLSKAKVSSLFTSVLSFFSIFQILHKYVETGPNCSYELVTFLKFHMPLSNSTCEEILISHFNIHGDPF